MGGMSSPPSARGDYPARPGRAGRGLALVILASGSMVGCWVSSARSLPPTLRRWQEDIAPGDSSPPFPSPAAAPPATADASRLHDLTIPVSIAPASGLYLLEARTGEIAAVPGAGTCLSNPIPFDGDRYVVYDRAGQIEAWDHERQACWHVEGEPGRSRWQAPSAHVEGTSMLFHDDLDVVRWSRVPRPPRGAWPLRGTLDRSGLARAWGRDHLGIAEAWADERLDRVALRGNDGALAVFRWPGGPIRNLLPAPLGSAPHALGPVLSCNLSPSGRHVLIEGPTGLYRYDLESRLVDPMPEIDLALGGSVAGLANWLREDGFLARSKGPAGQERFVLGGWATGKVWSVWSLNATERWLATAAGPGCAEITPSEGLIPEHPGMDHPCASPQDRP